MQVGRGVEMLAVFVVVVLMVPSATEGRLVDTCQLRDELNQTLNASLLDHLTTVAQIVCQVKLVSGFNTSAVHQITLPEVHYGHGKRLAHSASSSSSEESSGEDAEMPNLAFSTSTVGPVTHQRDNMSFTENGHGPRHARSVEESNSMESSEKEHDWQGHGFNSSVGPATQQNGSMSIPKDGHGQRHARSVEESSSMESSEEDHRARDHGFNSSSVGPATQQKASMSIPKDGHGQHHARSVEESSSTESSEEDHGLRGHGFNSSSVGPATQQNASMSIPKDGHGQHHARSVEESSSTESSEEDHGLRSHGFNSSSVGPATQQNASMSVPKDGHGPRHARGVKMLPNEKPRTPTPSSSSGFVKTTLAPKPSVGRWTRSARNAHAQKSVESGEDSTELHNVTTASHQNRSSPKDAGHGSRHGRSVHQSSDEESNESDFRKPKPNLNSTTSPQGNGSTHVEARRRVRSAPWPSSTESGETNVWTFYGLFQLPGRIACISENEPSYNLCNTTCDKLTNDDISDDIACVQTILNKTKSLLTCKRCGPIENVIKKMVSLLYKKECANVVDTSYFSACKH